MEQSPAEPNARGKTVRSRAKANHVSVRCTVANVHLGDGRVLRRGETCDVPRALARRLRAKGMVE